MSPIIRVVAGRILGTWVATAIAWAGARYGMQIGPDGQQKLIADVLGLFLLVWGTIYTIVHRWWDAKHNPPDAAQPGIAQSARMAQK